LDRLSGWERASVTEALWPALEEELVVPVDGNYRSAQALRAMRDDALNAEYRFLHDRVQQASYERIAPEQRIQAHLEIGRRLCSRYQSEGGTPQELLEVVRHLNLGSTRIESSEERKDLARLDLEAARAAKAASSHRLMASLVDTAEELLGEDRWREEPALSVELALERAEAAFLLREFDDVEARAVALLARPLKAVARLAAQELRVRSCVATGRYSLGAEVGRSALLEQGIAFPDDTEEVCGAMLLEQAAELDRWVERNPDAFDQMPLDPSLEHLLIDALMVQYLVCVGTSARPMLSMLANARGVSEARRRDALTPIAPYMLAAFTHLWSAATGMYRRASYWVGPGLRAAERTASPMIAECLAMKAVYNVYSHPIDECDACYKQAIAVGLQVGSFRGTSWALAGDLCYYRLWRGLPLGQVDALRRTHFGLVQRAGAALGKHLFELTASWCDLLMDPAGASRLVEEEPLSRGSRSFSAEGDGLAAEVARILEAHLSLIAGAPSRALSQAREAEQHRRSVGGAPPVTDIPLWFGLSAAQSFQKTADAEARARLCEHIEHSITRLRYFADGCAENFLHKLRLLEAEHARVKGEPDEAMAKYDEAIEFAREQRFLHIEALAAQLCADFHLEQGRRHAGALYLREAKGAYTRWGAFAVVAHLEAKYPALLKAPVPAERTITTGVTTTTRTTGGAQLDVHTAVRAAQALSSELDPTRVVGRLMDLVMENAGAQRGLLLLRQGEALSVAARLSVEGARIETGLSEPLGQSPGVATTVVQYVARTSEPVVLDDAKADVRFAADPYVALHAVLSLLALPLIHRGHLVGVLYLEHRDVPAAFPPARIELLTVLASQAAISMENALLYRDLEAKVTERTAELRIAKEEADRANRAKSDFLSSMSHELRTPLNGILGFAQILERMPDLPSKGREGARVIRKSGEHLLALINDVLDLAKIEAGKLNLDLKVLDFHNLVRTVVDMSRVRAEQKGLALTHELRGPALTYVYADERRLTQVLLNLLSNAIKFTQQGGVNLHVEVLEESHRAGRGVRFRITDTGPGIAPEHLPRIFDPFEQVGDERSRREGTGLGLSITKRVIEQMGGTIEVQSQLGKGSAFTVTLALAEAHHAATEGDPWSWETVIAYQGERRAVLVVDDNPANREVLRALLVPIGFELFEAEDGETALQMAVLHSPALILMDLSMPGMDGYETTRRLRQIPELRQSVIIASSARVSGAEQEKSARAGCNDFLPKPVQAKALLEKIQHLLNIEWIHREEKAQSAISKEHAEEGGTCVLPSAEQLATLSTLANAGRIGSILERIEHMKQDDPRLGPWLERLVTVARSFQIRKLQEFLQQYVTADKSAP
jgi:signal transduction histidine kinase/CheY-like chemotaxis protein